MPRKTGRFLLRLPPRLHQRLVREAARRGLSLNTLCVEALTRAVSPQVMALDGHLEPWVAKAKALHPKDLVGVVLFGSVARGENALGSDTDLLVVLESRVPIVRELYRVWDDSEPLDDTVNPHFVHLPEPAQAPGSIWLEAAIDGVVLADPDGRIARALVAGRRYLVEGRARPGVAHGQRYWIHDDA